MSIEFPFLDAMSEKPTFPKFLKTICSNGKKLDEIIKVSKEANVNAFMTGNLPPKLADPDSFCILIIDGNIFVDRALCDLAASVTLFPYTRLRSVNEVTPTRTKLQLVYRSIVYPRRILFDVTLRIGKLVVPCDFVIVDIPKDVKTPIILRRPCLTTASTLIDAARGKLVMSVGVEKVEFSIRDVWSAPVPNNSMYQIDNLMSFLLSLNGPIRSMPYNPFLKELGEIMQRYWDGKTLSRVTMLMILSYTMTLCKYMIMSRC